MPQHLNGNPFLPQINMISREAKKNVLNWILVMRRKTHPSPILSMKLKENLNHYSSLAKFTVPGGSWVAGQAGAGLMSRVQVGLLAQGSILHGTFIWITGWNVSCRPWHKSFMLKYFQLSGSLMVHLLHHQIPSGAVSNFLSSLLAPVQQCPYVLGICLLYIIV